MDKRISILLPSAYRSKRMWNAVTAILNSTDLPLEIIVGVVANDYDSITLAHQLPVVIDMRTFEEYNLGAVYAWNKLLRRATGEVIVLWADDLVPNTGCLEKALAELDEMGGHGLVGFNDQRTNGKEYAAHWLADRAFIENELGGVMYPPLYKSWWADVEVSDRAQALGLYRWARLALVEHNNYVFGEYPLDRTYRDANANHDADLLIYEQRKAAGYPLDWIERENTIILPDEPEPAAPVAANNGKHRKSKVGRSDRLLAVSE